MTSIRSGITVALALGIAFATTAAQTTRLRIVVIEGEDAVNIVQQKTATVPVVEVRDQNNLPVAGATVTFEIQGGRATFSGARTLTTTTNAAGRASGGGLAPTSSGAVQISTSAAFQGLAATATIVQTNFLTAAAASAAATAAAGGAVAAGGAAAGGAAAGGGGILGVSATTLGIIGGAAAGGTLIGTKALGGGVTYAGPISGQFIVVTHQQFVPVNCSETKALSGTMTLDLDIAADGAVSGDGDIVVTTQSIANTCGAGNGTADGTYSSDKARIAGTTTGMTGTLSQTFDHPGTMGGPATFTWSFDGSVVGDEITGTLTYENHSNFPGGGGVPANGANGVGAYTVSLRKK